MRPRSHALQPALSACALLVAAALVLPTVAGETVVSPNPRGFADADTQGRDYVAIAAGASDATIGDLAVLTTVKCAPGTGCDRDVWYRFMHAPSRAPTANGLLGDVGEAQSGCGTTPPLPAIDPDALDALVAELSPFASAAQLWAAALAAKLQQGCYNSAFRFLFSDLPVATTAADESHAFTDGRWVVYATGPASGPKDVRRFDARNPTDPAVPVASTAANEIPFGVGGDWVGVRTDLGDGKQTLSVKRLSATGAVLETRLLDTVNATDGASMSARRVAWSAGHTLFVHHLVATRTTGEPAAVTKHVFSATGAFSEPYVNRDTVAYVFSNECTAGSSTCDSLDFDPPRRSEVRLLTFGSAGIVEGDGDFSIVSSDVPIGAAATSSYSETTQTCSGLIVPRTRTATFVTQPFVYHNLEIVRVVKTVLDTPSCGASETRTTTEGLLYFERQNAPGNFVRQPLVAQQLKGPQDWGGRAPGQLGQPAASNHYVYLLDYADGKPTLKAYPWVHCYETSPGSPNVNSGPPTTRCLGAGPLAPT